MVVFAESRIFRVEASASARQFDRGLELSLLDREVSAVPDDHSDRVVVTELAHERFGAQEQLHSALVIAPPESLQAMTSARNAWLDNDTLAGRGAAVR